MLLGGGTLSGVTILEPASVRQAFADQLGDLRPAAVMSTTDPKWSCDVVTGAGTTWGWGVQLDTRGAPGMRARGSGGWMGIFNTRFWVDPRSGLAAAVYTQCLPFCAPEPLGTFADVERALYARQAAVLQSMSAVSPADSAGPPRHGRLSATSWSMWRGIRRSSIFPPARRPGRDTRRARSATTAGPSDDQRTRLRQRSCRRRTQDADPARTRRLTTAPPMISSFGHELHRRGRCPNPDDLSPKMAGPAAALARGRVRVASGQATPAAACTRRWRASRRRNYRWSWQSRGWSWRGRRRTHRRSRQPIRRHRGGRALRGLPDRDAAGPAWPPGPGRRRGVRGGGRGSGGLTRHRP